MDEKKISEIRNFVHTIEGALEPINNIIDKITNFLYNYHNDDFNSNEFDPLIKGINFDYEYCPDTCSLLFKYRLTRRKWLCINFQN